MLQRVTVLSGGGAGHEPAHVGDVGKGMLDAAVCGNIFASPNVIQIESGLRLVRSAKGIIVVVKNYTGDKTNFTLAAQRFQFNTGVPVRLVIVGNDVSIGRTKSARVGRRGIAGTVLVQKVVGAAALAGFSLGEVSELAEFTCNNMGTIGATLDACETPGQVYMPRLEPGEVEIGIGIHNEPGSRRISPKPELHGLVADILLSILDPSDQERNYLATIPRSGDGAVVVLVNNLGGVSPLEIVTVTGEVVRHLNNQYQLKPTRVYAGTFLSALNGPGFSITLLILPAGKPATSKVLECLDAPTDASGWTSSIPSVLWKDNIATSGETGGASGLDSGCRGYQVAPIECDPKFFENIIRSIHSSLVSAEPEITRLDNIMGDGDCGKTLLAGSRGIVTGVENKSISTSSTSAGLMSIANIISRCRGGTSGALCSVFFTALASAACTKHQETDQTDFIFFAEALSSALESLENVTAAREGDRTMMNALIPFVGTLVTRKEDGTPTEKMNHGLAAARAGCEATKNAPSKFGRSTYVSAEETVDKTQGLADPGAYGIVAIIAGLKAAMETQ